MPARSHRHRNEAADDHAARPPGMQHVEALRFAIAVDGRHERVDHAFDESLRQPHDHEARIHHRRTRMIEHRGDRRRGTRREHDEADADEIAERRKNVQCTHADDVDQRTADQD